MSQNILEKETVKNLIQQLKDRERDGILEKNNLEFLENLIKKADSEEEAIKIAELGTIYKKTGLHFDRKLEKQTDSIKVYKKNEKLSFDQGGIHHKLIIGDNYDALMNLLITHRNKIDVIYIDPPYGCDDMGDFAKTNYENQITRDNLLSMLEPRLILAKQLLTEEGVIFCSIDDKNQSYVKCLFDDIFGERNFVCNIVVAAKPGGRGYGKIGQEHEYILVYSMTGNDEFDDVLDENREFSYKDEFGEFDIAEIRNRNIAFNITNRPNLYYPIYVNPKKEDANGLFEVSLSPFKGSVEVFPIESQGMKTVWRWGKKLVEDNLNTNVKGKRKNDGTFMIIQKYRKANLREKTIWNEKDVRSEAGTLLLKSILNKKITMYPKPISLVKRLINLTIGSKTEAIVLDFFAGSGTTGHAVLESKGTKKWQFILCTNNEITQTEPNGIVHDITSERLRRIMTGEGSNGEKNFKWIYENKKIGDSLDTIDLVNISINDKDIFNEIDETMYGFSKKLPIKEKIVWVCNNFDKLVKSI